MCAATSAWPTARVSCDRSSIATPEETKPPNGKLSSGGRTVTLNSGETNNRGRRLAAAICSAVQEHAAAPATAAMTATMAASSPAVQNINPYQPKTTSNEASGSASAAGASSTSPERFTEVPFDLIW